MALAGFRFGVYCFAVILGYWFVFVCVFGLSGLFLHRVLWVFWLNFRVVRFFLGMALDGLRGWWVYSSHNDGGAGN
jgi:hypothetical protein